MNVMAIQAFAMSGSPEAAIAPIQGDTLFDRLMGKISNKTGQVTSHVWAWTSAPQS